MVSFGLKGPASKGLDVVGGNHSYMTTQAGAAPHAVRRPYFAGSREASHSSIAVAPADRVLREPDGLREFTRPDKSPAGGAAQAGTVADFLIAKDAIAPALRCAPLLLLG